MEREAGREGRGGWVDNKAEELLDDRDESWDWTRPFERRKSAKEEAFLRRPARRSVKVSFVNIQFFRWVDDA